MVDDDGNSGAVTGVECQKKAYLDVEVSLVPLIRPTCQPNDSVTTPKRDSVSRSVVTLTDVIYSRIWRRILYHRGIDTQFEYVTGDSYKVLPMRKYTQH